MGIETERLEAIFSGTVGATRGPWRKFGPPSGGDILGGGAEMVARAHTRADQSHIANCDPQTIAAIVSEVLALREALGPFDRLGAIILAEAPSEVKTIVLFTGASGEKFAVQLEYFRAAARALQIHPGAKKL